MTTALIVPFGAADTESGRVRDAIWNRCLAQWLDDCERHDLGQHLMVAGDPLFGHPRWGEPYPEPTSPVRVAVRDLEKHPFSVARAINNAVRLAQPEVDKFVCIGADAAPDWRVVDWAERELETRPWTLLFGKGANVSPELTEEYVNGAFMPHVHRASTPFASPCVGPIAFTRETFMAVRGFDERFEGWAYEDVDFWLRLRQYAADYSTLDEDPAAFERTSPYPLIQFSHPTDHHDLTIQNPNVRLWQAKQAVGDWGLNTHPAPHLFKDAEGYTGSAS